MPKSKPKPKVELNAEGDINAHDVIGRDQNITSLNISLTSDSPTTYATRAEYLAQLIDRHQDLEFVGIPELKDRHALRIEEVFIHLQAETEPELREREELRELSRQQGQRAEDSEFLEFPSKFPQFQKLKRRLSANEALRENRLLVILGDPGAGKTTLLKYITLAFAQNQSDKLGLSEDRLPIFVRLYDYVAKRPERSDKGFSLVDYLYVHARENLHLALEPNFFESELERGNCCVCLDGLDELGGAGLRREVTAAVAALANRYPRNRFIITSRSVGYDEAPLDRREFIHHTVLPLSDDDIREFVQKWYAAREKDPTAQRERAEHLTKTIMAEPRIKSLAANPLMLTIIALVHRTEGNLPRKRVELYEKCVTAMAEKRDEDKGLKVEERQSERPHYTLRRRLLEQLAFWMHNQPGERRTIRRIKKGDLELQLTNFLLEDPDLKGHKEKARQEASAFISLAKSRIGLLVEPGDGVFAFPHLTFQEYLAASEIENRCEDVDQIWEFIQPRLHDPHWREVVLLVLGLQNRYDNRPTELVRRIYESRDKYERVFHRHLFLAVRALADQVEMDSALSNSIIDRAFKIACSNELASEDAFSALARLQEDGRAIEGLLAVARDKEAHDDIRRAAAVVLGQSGLVDDATSILLEIAGNKKVFTWAKWVQSAAAAALGQLGYADDAVLSGLLTLARDKKVDVEVRREAAQALGQLGHTSDAILSGLVKIGRDKEEDPWVRNATSEVLGQLGHADHAVSILIEIASNKKLETGLRYGALDVLGRLGHTNDVVLSGLLGLTRDKQVDAGVRCEAAQALGQLGHADDAIPILLALARDRKVDAGVRREAAHAIGQLGQPDDAMLASLLALAQDRKVDKWVRRVAALAIGQLGQPDDAMLASLLALAQDRKVDAGVRSAAAQALGQLGQSDDAAPVLLTLAQNKKVNSWVRNDAAQALDQLGRPNDAALTLLEIAQDEEVDVSTRYIAVQALGKLGHVEGAVLSGLLDLTRDQKVFIQYVAYESLKALVGGEAESNH